MSASRKVVFCCLMGMPVFAVAAPPVAAPAASAPRPIKVAVDTRELDQKFIAAAVAACLYQVKVARMAVAMAAEPAIKQYALMLIVEYSAIHTELMVLAQAREVPPSELMPADKKAALDGLAKAGTDFDRQFLQTVTAHDLPENIRLFESASRESKDSELRAWIAKIVPYLREHLAVIRALPIVTSVVR